MQVNEKINTNFQLFLGCRHRLIDGIIPDCLNVTRNHPTYKQHKPHKPINPLVNELAPHGPSGAKSTMVCATIIRPAIVNHRHSGVVAMITAWWVMLERLYPLGFFMTAVNDAVIVAAGLGGRMLPTSAYLPKESLPTITMKDCIIPKLQSMRMVYY